MAEKWRRCDKCRRKVKSVEEYDDEATTCRACLTAPVRAARSTSSRPVTVTQQASGGQPVAVRDVRGRGDHEVRARRARVRALDRLAEEFPEDFARLLTQERDAEGL